MVDEDDNEPGIDKQKVIRAIDAGEEESGSDKAFPADEEQEKPRGPSWVKYVSAHSDEVSSLVILSVALLWLVGGLVAGNPIPVLIGALLVLPGVFALLQSFRS